MTKVSLLLAFAALLFSCEKEPLFLWDDGSIEENDNNFNFSPSPVFDVIAPSSAKLGDTVTIQVRSQGNSGCARFSHYNQAPTGSKTLNIRATQKVPINAVCTMNLTTLTSSFEFIPESRGIHVLNFWRGELHEYDFVTLEINIR